MMFQQLFLLGAIFLVAVVSVSAQDGGMLSPIDMVQTGPVLVGQTFLAGSEDPREGSAPWALVSHGIAEKLFTVNQQDEIVPQIADFLVKIDDLTWDITIKTDKKFSDGTVVDAKHVADALNDLNANNSAAQGSLGTFTATAESDAVVRIVSERGTHVMDAVLAEWVFVIYMMDADGGGNFVYSGPYAVETFGSDQIDLIPNAHYDGRSLDRPRITLKKFGSGDELAAGALDGSVDIGFHLPIDALAEVREADGVRIKSFEVGYHYMMFHNIDSLEDKAVRKAIDVAIDRNQLTQALSGGTGTRSLFPDYSPYYSDESDPHGHPEDAAQILEEAGWILNESSGKRSKDGQPLEATIVAYPHRPGLGIMQPIIAKSLEDVGFTVETILTGDDGSETQTIIDNRTFDLLLWAQHTLPAGDPLFFLSNFFRSSGGSNHANLQSVDVDAALDTLGLAEDHAERISLSADAQAAILSNVPVSNLVTPYWHVSVSDRMADYEPWGSDYYVIRPDLFVSGVEATDEDEEEEEHSHEEGEEHDSHEEGEEHSHEEGEDHDSHEEGEDHDSHEDEDHDSHDHSHEDKDHDSHEDEDHDSHDHSHEEGEEHDSHEDEDHDSHDHSHEDEDHDSHEDEDHDSHDHSSEEDSGAGMVKAGAYAMVALIGTLFLV